MVKASTGFWVWGLASAAMAASLTFLAVQAPDPAMQLLSILLAAAGGWLLKRCLSWQNRVALTGIALGSGGLISQIVGALAGLVVLALVCSLVVGEQRLSKPAYVAWFLGVLAIASGTALTASGANIPLSRLVGIIALIVAFGWFFQRAERATASRTLLFAGLTAAFGVFLSWSLGRPIFAESTVAFSTTEAGVTRAAGFQSHPNQAALVLSAAVISLVFHYIREQAVSSPLRHQRYSIACIGIIGLALLLTGSRSALLGTFAALFICAAVRILSGKSRRVVVVCALISVGALVLTQIGTFAGRSLNVWESSDGSAIYRADIQSRLWGAAEFTQTVGFGFDSGSLLSANSITSGINNIDNAWLYMLFAYGIYVPLGLLLLIFFGFLCAFRRSGIAAFGSIVYVAMVTSAENVWVLTSTSICVVLAVVASAEAPTNGAEDVLTSNASSDRL